MKYAVVYRSKTGNTAFLAEKIRELMPEGECVYIGGPNEAAYKKSLQAELVFVGFWTDRGACDASIAAFLKTLERKDVFIFGTAGFGGSQAYFDQILENAERYLDFSNNVLGRFMCRGRMPLPVRDCYEAMLPEHPETMQKMIDNFDQALIHPNEDDIRQLKRMIRCIKNN